VQWTQDQPVIVAHPIVFESPSGVQCLVNARVLTQMSQSTNLVTGSEPQQWDQYGVSFDRIPGMLDILKSKGVLSGDKKLMLMENVAQPVLVGWSAMAFWWSVCLARGSDHG
jgi:hypothetical protein